MMMMMPKAFKDARILLLCFFLLNHSLLLLTAFTPSPPTGASTCMRTGQLMNGQTTDIKKLTRWGAREGEPRGSACWRGGGRERRQRRRRCDVHPPNWTFRSNTTPPRRELCSRQDDEFVSGEALSRKEFEAWSAAAAEARGASGVGSINAGDAGDANAAVPIEEVHSARASPPGIHWLSLFQTVLDQLLFLFFFAWLSTPAIRAQVRSSFLLRVSGVALGVLGAVPMFVYGLYLGTRYWPWLETRETKLARTRRGERLKFFGKERQVVRVSAVSVPLAVLIGFCEECVYRGFLPLILAAKTGLPLAAIVGISAVCCGARHAGTLGSGIDAAVLGVYVHCLLLSTGSILVPIVAHAAFDATLFVAEHMQDTRPQQQQES